MAKRYLLFALILTLLPTAAIQSSLAAEPKRIAIAYEVGGRGDNGINDLAAKGLERAIKKYNISQIPVIDTTGFVGSLEESDVFKAFIQNKEVANQPIKEVMGKPYPMVSAQATLEEVAKEMQNHQAVLVQMGHNKYHIITKHDIIASIR